MRPAILLGAFVVAACSKTQAPAPVEPAEPATTAEAVPPIWSGTNAPPADTAASQPAAPPEPVDAAVSCALPSSCAAIGGSGATIELQRTACYGTCPVYDVTIAADGTVTWHGAMFVDATGTKTAQADVTAVRDLFALIGRSCFVSMLDRYHYGATDAPSAILTLTAGGATKTVDHYLSDEEVPPAMAAQGFCTAPRALTTIEKKIDAIAGTRRWIGKGGKKSTRGR